MYDVIIVGAGPTGGSAALFTSKAGKKTLVIDSNQSVTKRAWMENHYGVEAISGPDMIELGKRQAAKFGAEFLEDVVSDIRTVNGTHTVITEGGQSFETRHIILATGMSVQLAEKIGLTIVPGTEPRIKNIVKVDAQGKTGVEGIWAAGTVAGVSMHTIITAGDGAKVAINVISEINGERYVDHDVLKA